MKRNVIASALAGIGLLAAGPSHALLWTAPVPTPFSVVTFDGYDGFVTSGPEVVAPGVTFVGPTSSTLGAFIADLGGNGIWGAGKVFAGIGSFFDPVASGTMLFNFGSAAATAGAFVNVTSPDGKVTVTAFGANGVLESYEVTVDTPNGENAGLFLGIGRSSAEITGLSFSGAGLVLDDLSLSTAVVPLPPAAVLLAGGLAAMGWVGRRRKAA